MGTRYNAAAILAGMGAVVSQEDNDLNINIQADHEGDGEQGEAGVADFSLAHDEDALVEVALALARPAHGEQCRPA